MRQLTGGLNPFKAQEMSYTQSIVTGNHTAGYCTSRGEAVVQLLVSGVEGWRRGSFSF